MAMNDDQTRRLSAILAADVAGYTRLMADGEVATVKTLTDYRSVFAEHAAAHNGRIVDTAGDSVLVAFESVNSKKIPLILYIYHLTLSLLFQDS